MLLPDTVFMENGKPKVLFRSDRDMNLVATRTSKALGFPEIRQKFSSIVRERKRDNWNFVLTREMPTKHSKEDSHLLQKDVCLLRYEEGNATRVVNDTEFINEFKRRANDEFWKQISLI